jgi:hypothetical protein
MNHLLIKMFNNTFKEVEIMARPCLHYSSNPFYPSIEVLDLCDSVSCKILGVSRVSYALF